MRESMANFGKRDSWCTVTVRNLKYERRSGGNPTNCPIGSNTNWALVAIVSLYGCVFVSPCSSVLVSAENGKASVSTLTFHSKLNSPCEEIRPDSSCSVVRLTKVTSAALVWAAVMSPCFCSSAALCDHVLKSPSVNCRFGCGQSLQLQSRFQE